MERIIVSHNYNGRTYLLKKMSLIECKDLRLGDQIFKNVKLGYSSSFVVGVVTELTQEGFKFIDRDCPIGDYEVDLREDEYISNDYTNIYRILREEINPLSMNGFLGLYNLLDKTYPSKDDLIRDSLPARDFDGTVQEHVFELFIDDRCYKIINKIGNKIPDREYLFEDLIRRICLYECTSHNDDDILHKSKLTDNKELIDKYARQINISYLSFLPW